MRFTFRDVFFNLYKGVFNKNKIQHLGRWKIKDNKDSMIRLDRSNHDHCGTCGLYSKIKK